MFVHLVSGVNKNAILNAGDYEVTPAPDSVLLQQVCRRKESETSVTKCLGSSPPAKKYRPSPGLSGLLVNQS